VKSNEIVGACKGSNYNGKKVIEWLILWKFQAMEEATWEEANVVKEAHPPFCLKDNGTTIIE